MAQTITIQEIQWEGGNEEWVEAIQLHGQEAPSFPRDHLFRRALLEEMRLMRVRAEQGSEMAHDLADELTLYLSQTSE